MPNPSAWNIALDAAPVSPLDGDIWWDSSTGIRYVYYVGANSAFWVQESLGAQGYQGVQGAQGFQGVQGSDGHQGSEGFQGSVGFQGTVGFQGCEGHQGSEGFQGSVGFQGCEGHQGSEGFQGSVGFQGCEGFQGTVGFQGSQGVNWTFGNGVPVTNGVTVGDQYLDLITFDVYSWDGNSWILYGNIGGYQGSEGFQGSVGFQGSEGHQGSEGFHFFCSTYIVFSKIYSNFSKLLS